jgi:hypothetical protein
MRSKSAKRMVGKRINVPKRQDFRFWHEAVELERPLFCRYREQSGRDPEMLKSTRLTRS